MAAINLGSTTAGRGAAQPRLETPSTLETDAAIADAFLASAVGGDTAPARRRARFHTLEVAEVRPLTDDSVEVTFAVPDDLADDYSYLPGQYVALRREFEQSLNNSTGRVRSALAPYDRFVDQELERLRDTRGRLEALDDGFARERAEIDAAAAAPDGGEAADPDVALQPR